MNGISNLPSIDALKLQAKRLRADLEATGQAISHSRSLETIAHQNGFKDWNTMFAAAGNRPTNKCNLSIGQKVKGTYLGQPFTGEVLSLHYRDATDRYRVTFLFDEPVDVVKFDSFSSFRRRVSCNLRADGKTTVEKTSNGKPQLQLLDE